MEGKKKLHTLVFLLDPLGRRVLLGMKKRGRGAGRWNGFGGKVEQKDDDWHVFFKAKLFIYGFLL